MSNLSVTSPSSIGQLIDLSLFANEARKASQDAAKALDNATRGAIHYAAEQITSIMTSGASMPEAYGIVRARLDNEGFDAVMSHAQGFEDLAKVIRQAQKIMSRVASCAYAVVNGADANQRINKLEGIAGHIRKGENQSEKYREGGNQDHRPRCGFPVSLIPLSLREKGAVGRLHDVAAQHEESEIDTLRRMLAEQAETIAAYKASLEAVMHGNSSVVHGNAGKRTGKQKSTLKAA